jgi:hypothetical protein
MPVAQEEIVEGNVYVRDGNDEEKFKVVIPESMWIKDSSASNWHPTIMYYNAHHDIETFYVRSIVDFAQKFSKYVEPEEVPAD